MMRKTLTRLFTVALTLLLWTGAILPAAAAADPAVSGRSDFLWGVNGHNRGYAAYPERTLEEQIRLAAELGVKLYRFNFNPGTMDDLNYLDEVVKLVDAYGMEMMLVMDSAAGYENGGEVLKSRFRMVAERYNGQSGHGRIRYIQVFNEMDVQLMHNRWPNGGEGDGSTSRDYYESDLKKWTEYFRIAIEGIREGCADTKAVINFSYRHTYMLEYFRDNGLEWDIIGLDWYSNMGDISGILNTLLTKFDQDIIICETNLWPTADNDYDTNTAYLSDLMKQVYRYNDRIKGLIIYELLDEMRYEYDHGSFNGESHFGLVHCDKDGNIGAVKPAYTAVQKLLGGGPVTPDYPDEPDNPTATTTQTPTTATADTTVSDTTAPSAPTSESTNPATDNGNDTTDTSSPESAVPTQAPGGEESDVPTDTDAGSGLWWLFIVIPVAVLVVGCGIVLLLHFRFGRLNRLFERLTGKKK